MTIAAICLLVLVRDLGAMPEDCPSYALGQEVGAVETNNLVEASGLAASRQNPDVIWSHNDSGDTARLFAMTATGVHLGIYSITRASAVDWEDLAIGPGPAPGTDYLYIGDIGDNLNVRPNIKVYRVAEPMVSVNQTPGTYPLAGTQTITLAYPDGPRDAETLMVDTNGDIYIVTKRKTPHGRLYRAAFPQATAGTVTMTFIVELPWGSVDGSGGATGGDIASDGSAIIVRRYTSQTPQATLWLRSPGMTVADAFSHPGCNLTLLAEPQGEAVALKPGSLSFYTVSEGSHPPLHLIPNVSAADVTGDGMVNVDDLLAVINAWGTCPGKPRCLADVTLDQTVNIDDVLAVIAGWTGL